MLVRYFYVDAQGKVHKAAQRATERAFLNGGRWDDSQGQKSLWLLSFICDDRLRPLLGSFLPKLDVADGFFTPASRRSAIAAVMNRLPQPQLPDEAPSESQPSAPIATWPNQQNTYQQLAAALDIPIDQLPEIALGGPLVVA